MNKYVFTGISDEKIYFEGQSYFLKTFDIGIGFRAEIEAPSLRKSLAYIDKIFNGISYSLDNVYTVTNKFGKTSIRFLKDGSCKLK